MSNGKYHLYFSLEKSRAVGCGEMPVRFRVCRRRRFVRQSRECRRKRTSIELENWALDPVLILFVVKFSRWAFYIYFLTSLRGFINRNILDNRNYRTRHSIHFTRCSFSSLSNSLDEHFLYLFFFYFFKGFFPQDIFWTIITTVFVIVYSWSGAHFLCCQIL